VKNVVLKTCWFQGRCCAEKELKEAGWEPPFEKMVQYGGYDMLCPLGNNSMVLIDGLLDGEQDEDEDKMNIRAEQAETGGESPATQHVDQDISFEPDVEDLAIEQLAHLENPAAEKHDAYLPIDADEGGSTMKDKSSILHIFSNNDPNSTDRLRQVMDLSQFDPSGHGLTLQQSINQAEAQVHIQDPAATLVRSKNLVWLTYVQIVDLRHNNFGMQSLPVGLFAEPNICVRVQVMWIAKVPFGCENDDGDWEWTSQFERVSGSTSTCEVGSHRLQLVNLVIAVPTCIGNTNLQTYRFSSAEMVAITKLLYEMFKNKIDYLLKIPWADSFPYCTENGEHLVLINTVLAFKS
jgi:hypothetical protein